MSYALVTREYTNVVDQKVATPDIVNIIVETAALTNCEVYITLAESPLCELFPFYVPQLVFADNGGSPDTITRNKGSWIADGFRVGHVFTVANSVSNNSTFTVASVTEYVLTLDPGDALTDETVAEGSTVTMVGSIPDADWQLYNTVAVGSSYYEAFEYAPTGFRFVRNAGTGNVKVWVKS